MIIAKLSLLLVCLAQFPSTYSIEECLTPNQQQGECIAINNCEVIYDLLRHRPLSASTTQYLRKSQCGFEGTNPKVCCPLGSSPIPTSLPPVVDGPTDPNTVNKPVQSDLLPGFDTCGISTQDRIYGGEVTDLDEFPWMALIEYQKPNGRGFYCGGVLINKRYILTAAHCVKGKDLPSTWRLVSVRLGEYNTETEKDCINNGWGEDCAPPPLNIPVSEQIAHESYNPQDNNQFHDIALLRLKKEVTYSDFVKPICLPVSVEERSKSYTGQNLFVAGWGKTENRSDSNIKLKVQVPVRSLSDCTATYTAARVKLGEGQLCAGGVRGKDSCRGDSGGPLMTVSINRDKDINWYAAGIVSFGPSPCGMENWPGVYTKVSQYVPWIVSKLKP